MAPAPGSSTHRWRQDSILFLVMLIGAVAIVAWQFRPRGEAPDTVGWREDYAAALDEAARAGKPALVVFTAKWCGACQVMAHEVFPDEAVSALMRQRVIPVKVDVSQGGGPQGALAQQFHVQAIPALILVDPATGQVVARQDGGLLADDLTRWLEGALEIRGAGRSDL